MKSIVVKKIKEEYGLKSIGGQKILKQGGTVK